MKRRTHFRLLLALTSYALLTRALPGIGTADFGSAWDEGYYAMVARGAASHVRNLLYPFVYEGSLDRVLINKPPGFFWLGALALHLPLEPELALRLVSVIAGAATVPLFDALCRLYLTRRNALLASLALAASPLHVEFSRVYQMDVVGLFYALGAAYLLLRGTRRRSPRMIYAAGPVIGLALLTKLWAAAAPVFLLLPVLALEAKRRRCPRLAVHAAGAMVCGALLFALWPLAVAAWPAPYTGFLWMRPGSTVSDLLFSRYGTSRFQSDTSWLTGQLFAPYLSLGHFKESSLASLAETGLALLGAVTAFASVRRRSRGLRYLVCRGLPLLLWMIAFLPVQLGRDHYLQYLVVLVPVQSVLIGQGLGAAFALGKAQPPRSTASLGRFVIAALAAVLIVEPFRLAASGDEILYRTHYREMGAFIRGQAPGARSSAIARYPAGLSYYTRGMETPFDSRWPVAGAIARGRARFVDVKRSDRDNTIDDADRAWVTSHCIDVSETAAIPSDSVHALYDCGQARDSHAVNAP